MLNEIRFICLKSFFDSAVTCIWLKYCRYGVNHYTINPFMINTSIIKIKRNTFGYSNHSWEMRIGKLYAIHVTTKEQKCTKHKYNLFATTAQNALFSFMK